MDIQSKEGLSTKFWELYEVAKNEFPNQSTIINKSYPKVTDHYLNEINEEEGYLTEYENKQVLTNFINTYPSVCHRYGGSLPLSRLYQYDVVNIQASYKWQTSPYCYPRGNPSFRKLYPLLTSQ